ncbi:histidine phosphatase family protein [Mycolicibacterium mageritense]|uniref:histidine phosphatase family protein n=1 Tax=Mycolicibacterium mageritense TaxID=53462 RepID=UPI0011D8AD7B|nr:histidine phosphatase family protein [Mycolicibacterium mageritense]TXI58914.1 MAG: histidine phosphatase family protein [Mycolicibacterium mageritense]
MARSIYVVTHPEATHHVDGVVGGWHDSDLTTQGRQHADAIGEALGRQLSGEHVAVFSSDMLRTRRTADAIAAELQKIPVFDARLREKSYGVAEGRPQAWLDARFIPPPAVGDRMAHHEGIAGAETKAEFAERIYAVMAEILSRPVEHVVVVTHGFTLTYIITAWLEVPWESAGYASFASKPGSITTLVEDDFFHNRQVAKLADTTHLNHIT